MRDGKKDSEDTTSKSEENRVETSSEQTAEEEEVTEQTNESTVKEPIAVKEESEFQWIYDELNGKSFIFSSGAGAWRTAFTFKENGNLLVLIQMLMDQMFMSVSLQVILMLRKKWTNLPIY